MKNLLIDETEVFHAHNHTVCVKKVTVTSYRCYRTDIKDNHSRWGTRREILEDLAHFSVYGVLPKGKWDW